MITYKMGDKIYLKDLLGSTFRAVYSSDGSSNEGIIIKQGQLEGMFKFISIEKLNKNSVYNIKIVDKEGDHYIIPKEGVSLTLGIPVPRDRKLIAIIEIFKDND